MHEKLSPSCFPLPAHSANPQRDPPLCFRRIRLINYEKMKNYVESCQRMIKTNYCLIRSNFHIFSVDSQKHPYAFFPYSKPMDFFYVQAQTRAKSSAKQLYLYQRSCAFLFISKRCLYLGYCYYYRLIVR